MRTYHPFPFVEGNWSLLGNESYNHSAEIKPISSSTFYTNLIILVLFVAYTSTWFEKLICKISSIVFSLSCLVLMIIMAPIGIVFTLIMNTYRELARILLQCTKSDNFFFIDLVRGHDAYWSVDDETARSVINILLFVEFTSSENSDSGPLITINEIFRKVLLENREKYWKLLSFKKLSLFGYYYWEKQQNLNLQEHVKWMPLGSNATLETVNNFVSSVANNPLPNNDQSVWEVFVGREPIKDRKIITPVLFRVHHCVADGPSLLGIIDSFSKGLNSSNHLPSLDSTIKPKGFIIEGTHERSMFKNKFANKVRNVLANLVTVLFVGESLLRQYFLASDRNQFHGPPLSGKKFTSFYIDEKEEGSDENLLGKVKKIKSRNDCKFSDVIFTAVSEGLESQFQGIPPQRVTVVVPTLVPTRDEEGMMVFKSRLTTLGSKAKLTRLVELEKDGSLQNDYSIFLLDLPLRSDEKSSIKLKLEKVIEKSALQRKTPDLFVNNWFLKNCLSSPPLSVMKKMFNLLDCTVALSNIPGPRAKSFIGQNKIEDITFFLPNKGTTGIGISVFSYGGKLSLGLLADSAVIPDKNNLDEILMKIVYSINKLEKLCS